MGWWRPMSVSSADILNLKMNRKGFGQRKEIREQVKGVYHSDIVDDIKASGFSRTFGRITVHLAKEFGFCYGVDRAVELAYETRRYNPNKRIFLTTEIIHNPTVNQDLLNMGIRFLSGPYKNANEPEVTKEDLVIVPAFGTSVQELQRLYEKGCHLVDTICGSVIVVWKRVERYAKEGYTSVIHGKYWHEETIATSSRVAAFPRGHYLVVLDENETRYACDYIVHGGDKEEFLKKFKDAISKNFDPDEHLQKIGIANQTTMLSSESLHIAEMFQKALGERYGEVTEKFFSAFDTICSATQERQDAMLALEEKKPDLFLIVGGYNSANTSHLHEIALECAPSYHINAPECIVSATEIRHKPFGKKEEVLAKSWLPKGEVSIGVTAGASTPDKVMGDVIKRVLEFQKEKTWGNSL